jgi:ADP-ribose pyrophosphatase
MSDYDSKVLNRDERGGFLKVQTLDVLVRDRENGSFLQKRFECLNRKDSVSVLLYHRASEKFIWTEQFRAGHFLKAQSDVDAWPFEALAGMIEPGQTPEEAAHREGLEETGLHIASLHSIGVFVMCPGVSSERMHMFFGISEDPSIPSTFGGLAEEQENIVVHALTYEETKAMQQAGRMTGMPTQLLIQWLELHAKALGIPLECSQHNTFTYEP